MADKKGSPYLTQIGFTFRITYFEETHDEARCLEVYEKICKAFEPTIKVKGRVRLIVNSIDYSWIDENADKLQVVISFLDLIELGGYTEKEEQMQELNVNYEREANYLWEHLILPLLFMSRQYRLSREGDKGVLAMLLVDTGVKALTSYTILDSTDIPETLGAASKEQIGYALIGYQNAPKKIYVVAIPSAESYSSALDTLETLDWDYLVCPTAKTDSKVSEIVTWIKTQRTANHKIFKAVLPEEAADFEGVINVSGGYTNAAGTALTAEQACARIAGIVAGTPMTISCTYAPLPEALTCPAKSQEEIDTAVDNGELVLMWDGEKVKIVRGVNSFKTTTQDKGDSF